MNGATNTTTVTRNRLMSDGTYSYTYDDEGNTTQKVTIATGDYQTYTWDHRNRLIRVEFKDSTDVVQKTVRYTYDAFDRRVLTEVDADADGVFEDFQRSVWDGSHVSLVLDETSTVEHRFLHGPMVDMVLADESATDGLLWYLTDHQNTVRDVIDNTGTVLNHIDYTSFGEILTETDDTYTPYFAYTGRELDQHTGLQYNRARWYDPRTGRWLSEDPIRWAAGDVNLQRYVGNSVNNAVDPTGLEGVIPQSMIDALNPHGSDSIMPRRGPISNTQLRQRVAPLLQPGESVPPDFQPGGPSDVPFQLKGTWDVSIVAASDHAWIRFENPETGEIHTAGKYKNGYGGRVDEDGNQVVVPVSVPGIQWDRDLVKEGGIAKGDYAVRTVRFTDPKIYTGPNPRKYFWYSDNCSTYARDAWYYYTREWRYLPTVDLPTQLVPWIHELNSKGYPTSGGHTRNPIVEIMLDDPISPLWGT